MPLVTFGARTDVGSSPLVKAIAGLLVVGGAAVVARGLTKPSRYRSGSPIWVDRITAKIPTETMQEVVFERRR
jgi:hypothetical protein